MLLGKDQVVPGEKRPRGIARTEISENVRKPFAAGKYNVISDF